MSDTITQNLNMSNTCNICKLKIGGSSEDSCPEHFGILPYLQNSKPEYAEYRQYLTNKARQQANLPALEFTPRSKKFSEQYT